MGLCLLAFSGVFGCSSAVCFFPYGVLWILSPCVFLILWRPWLRTRYCGSTVVENSSFLWFAWFCCIPGGGGITGCCFRLACEDERGYTRSRDLDLSDLLERFPYSADGDEESIIVKSSSDISSSDPGVIIGWIIGSCGTGTSRIYSL